MTKAPLHAPLGKWAGPYRSGYGWHLIRVSARAAGELPSLASVRDRVRTDWLADFRERDRDARIARLVAAHQIVRLDKQAGR
jgi:parvulin-like peptidyl-prolyl isomerase